MSFKQVSLNLKDGLHARPASEIIQFCKGFKSNVKMNYEGRSANCKSIISLLALGVKSGAVVEVVVEGENESVELDSLVAFLENLGK